MAAPKPYQLSVTSTQDAHQFGVNCRFAHIENTGITDCLIDFDRDISANSFVLKGGQFLEIGFPFVSLRYKTSSGTTTLQIIKVYQ